MLYGTLYRIISKRYIIITNISPLINSQVIGISRVLVVLFVHLKTKQPSVFKTLPTGRAMPICHKKIVFHQRYDAFGFGIHILTLGAVL